MKVSRITGVIRAYLMSIAFWYGIALLMGWQFRFVNQNLFSSFGQLLMLAGAQAFALALWTPPIFYLVGRYLTRSKSRTRYILACSMGAVPFVLLHTAIQWLLIPPYDDALQKYVPRSFHSWVDMIRSGFADQIFIYIAILAAAHAYEYLKRLRKQERERYEYQQALAASELQVLKMQLHPHFLFNTLNGIATLVERDSSNARAMIVKLSHLLRTALDRDSSDLIPLQDELSFVSEYLDLEKMRFASRLNVTWQIGSDVFGLMVPQMILQPLVENAIRHGVAPSREPGAISVSAGRKEDFLELQIRNTVGGGPSNGTGVGLRNVEARLKHLYGGGARLQFGISDDNIAITTLTLPVLVSQLGAPESGRPEFPMQGKDPLCAFSSLTTNR